MISRSLKFGGGKTRIEILLNVMIRHQKAIISLNKYEYCTLKVRCCTALYTAVTWKISIFLPFQKRHLLAENELAFSISLSAVFVQTKDKIDPYF